MPCFRSEPLLHLTLSQHSSHFIQGGSVLMEDDMRKLAIGIIGAAAALAFAGPAAAQSYGWSGHHAQEHDELGAQHEDGHDQLDEQHAEAHDWGLSGREHRQLHRELRYEHQANDRDLRQEHRQHDRNDRWNRYRNYGSGYYAY
jgi:hypothetical protein